MSKEKKTLSRRKFIVRGGLGTLGVLAVGTYILRNPIRRKVLGLANSMDTAYMGNTNNPMLWFEITEQNTVRLHSPKVEMGQGNFTGLAQMAADELDVNMEQIEVVHATTATGNIDGMATGGSTSISGLWQPLREMAATTREMLKIEAAKKLGVDPGQLLTENASVKGNGQSLTYAEVAMGVTEWDVPDTPPLKDFKAYKYIGTPVARIDLSDKVFGEPIFGMDATMPGMLYGAVVRPTTIGATFESADTSKAENMPGVVKVIKEDDFVGVVARSMTEAENAKQAITVNWKTQGNLQTEDIVVMMTVGNGKSTIIQKEGQALKGEDIVEMEFRSPIGAHAQIEPNGVLASVEGEKATIMISTQVIGLTRKEVADRLNLDEEKVNVIPTYLGGGFGRRLHTPHAVQAALMSKAVGKPVKYFFSRKEEFQHDMFRPPTHHILKGRLNKNGLLEGLEHHFVSGDVGNRSALVPNIVPSILGADIGAIRGGFLQYTKVPKYRSVYWHVSLPFATSWWRSLGLLANTFAIESFIDAMAVRSGMGPVDFRLRQIADDPIGIRLKETIKSAAEKAGYVDQAVNGRAMGLAASIDSGTPCAQVAEVSIEDGKIKVHKVTCALDPGIAVNPDQVRAQCEGAIIMGISAGLHEQMYVENGSLQPTIYGPYEMALMKHAPKEIDVVLLQGRDRPGPVGEPPLGPIAAAVANAVFRLTGKRLLQLPLKLS
ncbi:molybdopterin-dependent oxidoreductase [Zobellia galactanivorans]|uniref:xanthine dehydrogenase family protein molybdopterin-binding subunit n=2 Tax=Zobellia galactanivorans (strain DSM 12802 / CCUG 47099 / CIP 106680 / NCIMB 13871 / Dsij) TaxID=63186 RepID=UPI0026E411F2|nr:molybdopterin cofactor-binding domain-containing protein [Zobellia galactanivorans]MDO6809723.1 molybdopterin-dependent oxidoreductase [Zobellia galactanivorans]